MTFNRNCYDFDYTCAKRCDAKLKDKAILYRIASPQKWDASILLNAHLDESRRPEGRYNIRARGTVYCANNFLINIAEVLFHMYMNTLASLRNGDNPSVVDEKVQRFCRLVIFKVREITDLFYIDCEDVFSNNKLKSALLTHPDKIYGSLQNLAESIRGTGKNGIVYPSARHRPKAKGKPRTCDVAFAFFWNQSDKIYKTQFEKIDIKLKLIPESQDFNIPPQDFRPEITKIHPTIGYYEILQDSIYQQKKLQSLVKKGLLNPTPVMDKGFVDFVRRIYTSYPKDAVIWKK